MSYVFSIHLSDEDKKHLDKLMGCWPTKSRNGVIRHIISTYGISDAEKDAGIQWLEKRIKALEEYINR